jgi:hypothetical protein
MSEESEEFAKSLHEMIESRRDEAEQLKRANEEELRIRHGIRATLDEHGQIEAKTISGLDLGAKRRGRIEKDINDQLEKILGKSQALQNRKQVLYEKELENYGYFIDDQQNLTKMLSKQNVDLDKEQKKVLERLRKEGVNEERAKAKKAEVQKAQDEFGSNLAKGLGDLTKGLGNFATGLASGNTNFTSLNPLIDIVANSLASLAKAIPFVGEAIAGVTKAAAEGAKFVLELMDKNLKAFQELANAGALTAEGMEGVSRQFLESGMSLEGFKKAIRENAGDLAQWGKTVGGGADKFTKAVGMLTKGDGPLSEAGLELRKLGMTSDDIGTAAAGFLTQELRLGRARNMTEEQLAKGTAKYANELDALQKITGLSKEELIKQRNEMMSDSRFGASMDMLREENAAGAEAMMTFASTIKDPELKRGFMDLASGAANTDAAKKALVQMGSTVPDMIEKLKNAKPENVAKVFDETQTMLKKGAKEYSENFREAAAIMPDTKKLGNWTVLNEIAKSQNISMEEAIEVQKKQKAASGGLTEDTVKAQQNMERMGQEVWKMGNTAMPKAAAAVEAFTKGLVKVMAYINKILGKDEETKPLEPGAAGKIGDNGELVGGAGGEGDAGAIMEAAREGQATRSMAPKGKGSYNAARDSQAASPPAPNPTSASQLADAGLKLKKGDVQAEGKHVDPDLIDIAKDVQANIPGFMQFTGFNDQYHNEKASGSQHTKGNAFDFVVAGQPSKRQGKEIVDMMKDLGLNYAQDEYNNASSKSTGGHFHGQLKAYDGGVFEGPIGGYDVELHGREAIVPLPDPNSVISVDNKDNETVKKDPLDSVMNSIKSLVEFPDLKSVIKVNKDIDKDVKKDIDKDSFNDVMNSIKSLIELPNPKSISNVDKIANEDVKKDPLASVMKSIKSLIELPDLKSLMDINEGAKKEPLSTAMKSMNNLVELPDSKSLISNNEVAKKEPVTTTPTVSSNAPLPGVDQLAGITQAMMQMMENKFDEMISQLSTGNNIQDKLLRNSMV